MAVWEAEKKKIEADRKATRDARKIMLEDLRSAPVAPLYPFLTAPEPTIEGLIKAMPRALGSLGLFSAEGGQFVGGHGMSTDNRLKTAAALSSMWDGDTIKRIRAGDGVSILKGRRLSLHIMIQPDVATGFLADPLLRDQGLLSRILVAAPCSKAGTRTYQETAAADETAIRDYGGHILELCASLGRSRRVRITSLPPACFHCRPTRRRAGAISTMKPNARLAPAGGSFRCEISRARRPNTRRE